MIRQSPKRRNTVTTEQPNSPRITVESSQEVNLPLFPLSKSSSCLTSHAEDENL